MACVEPQSSVVLVCAGDYPVTQNASGRSRLVLRTRLSTYLCLLTFVLLAAPALFARGGDRVQIGKTLYVSRDEAVSDIVCIGCSVHMEGSCGDVVTIGGSIEVRGDTEGDVVAIGGTIRLDQDASVGGNVVTVGGRLFRNPGAAVRGNVSTGFGLPYLIGFVVVPFLPLILIVVLIVWLVQRNRRRGPVQPA
jgi:hypothetical protein